MDKTYPPEAWQHLGKVLERRRGQLGYGFRQREQFLRDRGGPPPSVKMLARLERGERTTYPDSTVTLLESMYGYAPGSFEAILSGGEGVPVPGRNRRPELHPATGPVVIDNGEPDDSAWRLFPRSPEKRALWRLTDGDGHLLPERVRAELVAAFDQAVREARDEDEDDDGVRGRRAAG